MKIVGAVLALLGIVVVAVAAIQHFNPILPTSITHLSIYLAVVGVVALVVGAVLGRVGGDGEE
jgi:hypothetical protein